MFKYSTRIVDKLSNNSLNINDTVFMYGIKPGTNPTKLLKVTMTIKSPETCVDSLGVNLDCKQLCGIVNPGQKLFRVKLLKIIIKY